MGDNRYIWFAEEHGEILKNADQVRESLVVILGTVIDGAYRTVTLDQEE